MVLCGHKHDSQFHSSSSDSIPDVVCDLSVQTYFLPVIGLVDAEKLSPGDLVVRVPLSVSSELLYIPNSQCRVVSHTNRLLSLTYHI